MSEDCQPNQDKTNPESLPGFFARGWLFVVPALQTFNNEQPIMMI